jgi:indole-3-glycerol phosphate synthase
MRAPAPPPTADSTDSSPDTSPKAPRHWHFHGSLANLKKAVATGRPVLMRDIILDELQIDCAASLGASGVLLTASVLPKKRLAALIEYAHLADREVVLEVANRKEYEHALTTEAELICVNNRDLKSFELDLDRTRLAIEGIEPRQPVISHGGLRTRADVERVMEFADAVLVGSALIEGETTIAELRAS